MRVQVATASSILGLVLALAACSTGQSPEQGGGGTPNSISVAVSSSEPADALQTIAVEFEDETGISVEFVDIPYDQLASEILLGASQPGQGFDVVQYDSPMLASLVEGGALADISNQVESSDVYKANDFPDQVSDYAKYRGTNYGIPLSTEPYVLWYRTDLFGDLGLQPEPTWDTYVSNAQALDSDGIYGSGLGFGPQIGAYYWLEAIYLHGGTLLEPGTCTPNLNTPEALEATETYLDLLDTTPGTAVNGGGNEMTTAFVQGEVGQQINATGYWPTINDPDQSDVVDTFDVALPPMAEGGQTLLFGWLIGIGAQSTAQDAAWEFLEYALGQDSADRLIEAGTTPPARQSLLENESALEALPYLPTLIEASAHSEHLPYITQMPEIITALSVELSEAATDRRDANTLVEAAQSQVEAIMQDAEDCA